MVPGWLKGTPAVTTTSSPGWAKPSMRAMRVARVTVSVMVCSSPVTTAWTPQTQARRRAVCMLVVRPSTGQSGRSRATRSAVLPPSVKAAMAAAPTVCAICRDAAAMALAAVRSGTGRLPSIRARQPGSRSTRSTMRSIMFTASYGYCPAAVSADSITASAPSNTAVATSDASARVGAGAEIMLSSICVATTTGMPRSRAARMMRFWASGTSSGGSSTPRSPRATITASDRARMSSMLSRACGFSILVMIQARPAAISFASATSSPRCTKLRPM